MRHIKNSHCFHVQSGAHNEKQTGRGRSAKRPRSRLKFQIFPTVVELLNLDVRTRLHAAPRHATAMFFSMNELDRSLVYQTTPFPSTGCIASPARGREGLATLAGFL